MTNSSRSLLRAALAACGVGCLAPATVLAQPANDNCGGEVTVTTPSTTAGTNVAASGTDITSCAFGDTLDVWYRFVAPSDATYQFDTEGTVGMDTTLSLFSPCGGAQLVCDDDGGTGLLSLIQRFLLTGEEVYIRVAGYNGVQGNFNLNVSGGTPPPPPPANDTCANAIALVLPYAANVDSAGATADADVSCNDAAAFETNNGVWYKITPAADVRIRVAETGGQDVVWTLFSGDCTNFGEIACINNATDTGILNLQAGVPYLILVGQYGANPAAFPPATLNIAISELPPFVNDDCSGAVAITNNSTTIGANNDAGGTDITSCAGGDTLDVWYSFTAAEGGTYIFDTEGTVGMDTTLALFDACGGGQLACDDDAGTGLLSMIVYNLGAGQQVFIRVAGYNGAVGTYNLNVSGGPPPPPPANDQCANATTIAAFPFNDSVAASGATNDIDVSCNAAADFETGFGIWYKYTPTETGAIVLNETSANNVVFTIFSGGCFGAEVFCSDAEPAAAFTLQAGTEYHILVGAQNSTAVPLTPYALAFTYTPAPGACCIGANCQIVAGASACAGLGGAWQGAGVGCGGEPVNPNTNQVAMPDFAGGVATPVTTTFDVTDNVTVTSVKVFVGIQHTWVGDLILRLTAPNGAVADLVARAGSATCDTVGDGDNVNGIFIFDDAASQSLYAAALANAAAELPAGSFTASTCGDVPVSLNATFGGGMALGTWTLEASDNAGIDTGSITSFGVVVNNLGTPTPCMGGGSNGACCNSTQCSVIAQAACTGPGTRFAGANTVCNVAGNLQSPCCRADYNQDGSILLQDLFDFLGAWFAQDASAQIDQFPGVALEDLFTYLGAWFTPCP